MRETAPPSPPLRPPARRPSPARAWIVLILLLAAALRLSALPEAPPGMTHDEADHGLTAWGIVNGTHALYFPIGYGREPLYDYATALVMAGTGPTILAARLTSVYFGLLLIAGMYAWTRRAFGAPAALLTAAGLAAGFWPLMTARQALRSIALPAVFVGAVLLFWEGLWALARGSAGAGERGSKRRRSLSPPHPRSPAPLLFGASGLLLGLSLYTYIPARVMWLALPALVGYLWLARRDWANRAIRGLGVTLLVAAVIAAPLALYLASHPGLEVRIGELSAPLRAAASGDFGPLWANTRGALRLFTVEGDGTWRYNIPGRPLLPPVLGALFYVGLAVAAWLAWPRNRVSSEKLGFYSLWSGPAAFLALVWLALGFAPVLVTGPGLSTTQAIGALPVVYLFPALAMGAGFHVLTRGAARFLGQGAGERGSRGAGEQRRWSVVGGLLVVLLFGWLGVATARDYFGRWASSPEVRVQYETTMVTALRHLDGRGGAAAVSTITPGPFHTPAVALLTLRNPSVAARWFDGRESLLLPDAADSTLVVPGFTPLPDALQPYLAGAELVDELPMRPDDLDRPVRFYALDGALPALNRLTTTADGAPLPARFGEHVELLGYELSAGAARPGETLSLVTVWRLLRPLPGASLFAHLDGPAGLLAQADALGAPGELWRAGDVLLQHHEIVLPVNAPAGTYPLAVGVYTPPNGPRLSVAGAPDGRLRLTTVTVLDE
ncbi:hypothetical protein [Promineifilum sp.]|uniref:hypothetical protein n=1 Tax=Promineifilum sp. TaxID=2664178 RepID=UPI0035B4D3C8